VGDSPSADSERESTTTKLVARPLAPQPLGVVVRWVGPRGGAAFRLRAGRCVIGSEPGADLVISAESVSRRHAELELAPEGVTVRDLGSRNGTFFLGQRIQHMTLAIGGHLEIGQERVAVEADADALAGELDYPFTEYGELVGVSQPMRRLFALLTRLEGSLATVLVEGESGVGKELVARAIHHASSVCDGPFVPINCGAISRELTGSELFGHRRGAFSGAVEERKGAFESAHGGTLFLDEVGELPLEVQPALLRALESGEVRRVGSDRVERVSVRIVAATNRRLDEEVTLGRFRSDLFYRLAVVRLAVAPLRERPEDVEPLARRLGREAGVAELPAELVARLRRHDFPGNVRELKNTIASFAALRVLPAAGPMRPAPASDQLIAALVDADRPYLELREEIIERFSKVYLERILERAGHNQTAAAKLAGLDRTYFGRLLARYGMR
jgi:transcriptional regulator with GAF, ATPase, and Fis domain